MTVSQKKDQVQVLVGTQWGDEGKGRVVDVLASRADVVVRYQGGANAGHTVIAEGKKHVFHILPSGILYPDRICVIGNGVVMDPDQLLAELEELDVPPEKNGTRLVISFGTHIVMPYHKQLDKLNELMMTKIKTGSPIGTTGRGIGPCYVDKFNRTGIRAEDLISPDALKKKLELNVELKNSFIRQFPGEKELVFDELYSKALEWGRAIAPYLGDSTLEIDQARRSGKRVLFEGAQATLLDIDHGTYPFVTSSSCSAGGACTGGAIGPHMIDRVIGVVKAYCTRVGEGPFPTELNDKTGEELRQHGAEFGATTGRPRRCGWLDMVALDYAVKVNGLDVIALTKLDVLTGIDTLKVCVGYESGGKHYDTMPGSAAVLHDAVPVYQELAGWSDDISGCRRFEDLPTAAQDYVRSIEERSGVKVGMIGVGPGREDTIFTGI